MRRAWLNAALAMAGLALLMLCGCGGGAAGITIQIEPSTTLSLDEGQSFNFTATVANDLGNKGVLWSLVQTSSGGCSGAGCGALQNATNSSVTYVAPTNLTAGESVTLTAKAVANQAVTATVTISVVLAPAFSTTTLPNGANGVPYNQTIAATGGVAPLKFSLSSGGLPAGLSLSQSGAIVGRPSAPALNQPPMQSTFTVMLSDSATPPATVAQSFSVTVVPPSLLSIPTTSLPSGFANARYNGGVSATGGVTPLTWSVSLGSGPFNNLPPGLGLNRTSGQITGIVPAGTATGTYSFTVQAQDNSLPSPQTAQALLSITIAQPPPLSISTTTLPPGTTATAYNTPLQATGGIQPYTWTVTSGLLPSGLTLAPDGTLSGIPVLATTSPDQFTVQVQDSEATPAAAAQQLSITIAAGSTSSNSLFHGQYSFLFRGFDSGGLVAIAGTLSADGNGNITSGVEDSNRVLPNSGPVQVVSGIALTGTYSIGTDGRGTLRLIATSPVSPNVTLTTDYRLVLDSSGNIRFIQNNDITAPGVNTDTLGTHGAGVLKLVLGSGFAASSLSGNYAFEFTGQDLSGKPVAFAGAMNADGASILRPAAGGLNSDFNDAGSFSSQNLSGNFSFSGSRGVAQLTLEIGSSQKTLTFAFYFVSFSDVYFIETDSPLTTAQSVFYRLSGEMILQPSADQFTNSSLSGASVVTGAGLSGTNASVLAGLLTSPGDGTATLAYDENNGGTLAAPSFPGTYSVASNGRVAFTGFASSGSQPRVAVAYLTGPGQGFFLGSDAAATAGLLEQQAAAAFGASSIQGGYTMGTPAPGDAQVPNVIGQVSADGAGSITGTVDEIDPPTKSSPEGTANLGQPLSAHINFVGANGRGTITTNSPAGVPTTLVFYIVSPGNFRAISADSNPGNGHPEVFFFDH